MTKIIEKLIGIWTKYSLVLQQKKNIASLTILENYMTSMILEGEALKRTSLIDIQNKLNESRKFLKYLSQK